MIRVRSGAQGDGAAGCWGPEARVAALARRLRDGNIGYPFLFCGPFLPDGRLREYPFGEEFRRSFRTLLHEHPSAVALPWVGGVQGKQVSLEDAGWRGTAVGEVARLMDALGVDGVHLDFENSLFWPPLDPAHPRRFNRFVAELRRGLPGAFVSAVIPSTAPRVSSWKQPHAVEEVDELAAMLDPRISRSRSAIWPAGRPSRRRPRCSWEWGRS